MRWDSGIGDFLRSANNNCFYPIIVKDEKVIGFGEILDEKEHPEKAIIEKDNKLYAWPIEKGIERRWRWIRENAEAKEEFFRFNKKTNKIEHQKILKLIKQFDMKKADMMPKKEAQFLKI